MGIFKNSFVEDQQLFRLRIVGTAFSEDLLG